MSDRSDSSKVWPELPLTPWKDTYSTLHMWTQIVGKIRLALAPAVNHFWHVPLYVDSRGLTTSAIPYTDGFFEIYFDFIDHVLRIETSVGASRVLRLEPRAVADFYADLMAVLRSLGIEVSIWRMPVEIPNPIPFDEDRQHASYDSEQVHRFWTALLRMTPVFEEFRGRFIGKASPVHFFWGSFDLAATRFSGRLAPERPGADRMMREAYSHEVISAGFWPGGNGVDASFYAYAVPEPAGYAQSAVLPGSAYYHPELKEFLLPYESVRQSASPRESLREFLQSTYDSAANLGKWDRAALERR
ncbi:MAG TPA: DUF5996 family protein [Thermoanaerobaculia bacterium]